MTEGTSGRVLHLAHVVDWAMALTDGFYDWSTRESRLSQVGFIHPSGSHQVRGDMADLEVLDRLRSNDVVSRDAT